LASVVYRPGIDVDYIISNYLPPWQEAQRLYQLYLEQAPWFFGAVTRRQLEEEVLPLWYKEAPRPVLASSPSPGGLKSPSPSLSDLADGTTRGNAHDLALLFIIFCFGSMTDMEMPPAPNNPEADHYYELVKACLTIEPILTRPPAVSTVQALALMGIYEGILGKENSIETTWVLFGLATKLAQSVSAEHTNILIEFSIILIILFTDWSS
jgi:Fungal specific transcription factor domain